ncbi:MAG: uroporphyrinogen-III synthase [Ilumatobacteraceae bacterium]
MTSLTGRTVVITRPADQAGETAELLEVFGAVPLVVPLIEVVDDPNGISRLHHLDLAGIDWIVVTSPNGASRTSALIRRDATRPRVAAIGSATAAALPRCDLVPAEQSALGLLAELPSGPGRVVVVQAPGAASTLVDGLRERAWDVVAVSPYRTQPVAPSADQQRAALAADAVLFASGSAARAWVEAFGDNAPPVAVAIGQQTATVATQVGLKITVVSTDHSVYGMLVALSRYFSDGN